LVIIGVSFPRSDDDYRRNFPRCLAEMSQGRGARAERDGRRSRRPSPPRGANGQRLRAGFATNRCSSVILRPYEGTVHVQRRVFRSLLDQLPTPERCKEAFHLQRTRFEMIVERKLRRRQLTEDGNVEITGRDLREKTPPVGQGSLFARATAG
jgi:hypothetical protein